jgi:hypothetical protein
LLYRLFGIAVLNQRWSAVCVSIGDVFQFGCSDFALNLSCCGISHWNCLLWRGIFGRARNLIHGWKSSWHKQFTPSQNNQDTGGSKHLLLLEPLDMLPSPTTMLQGLGSPNPNLVPNTGAGGGPASQNISNVRELSNTNNDRLSTPTPTIAQMANSPAARSSIGALMRMDPSRAAAGGSFRPASGVTGVVSKTRREQAELLMSLGEQFPDSTIPDGDPLPDVDSEATAMLLDFSNRAQSPHHQALLASAAAAASAAATASASAAAAAAQAGTAQVPSGNNAAPAGPTSGAGTQKDPPLDLTRRRTLYDLTPDALLPLQSKMPGTGEAVERWSKGPALRHMKSRHDESGRPRGDGSSGAGGNSASGAASGGASVGNGRKLAPNPWTLAALKTGQKKEYPCTQCGRIFHSRSELR